MDNRGDRPSADHPTENGADVGTSRHQDAPSEENNASESNSSVEKSDLLIFEPSSDEEYEKDDTSNFDPSQFRQAISFLKNAYPNIGKQNPLVAGEFQNAFQLPIKFNGIVSEIKEEIRIASPGSLPKLGKGVNMAKFSPYLQESQNASFFKFEKLNPNLKAHIATNSVCSLDLEKLKAEAYSRGQAGASLMLATFVDFMGQVCLQFGLIFNKLQ